MIFGPQAGDIVPHTMNFLIEHVTRYRYGEAVPVCHNLVHLQPRETAWQHCDDYQLAVTPEPEFSQSQRDPFGNAVHYFSLEKPHRELIVTARSGVTVRPRHASPAADSPPWEEVVARTRATATADQLEIYLLSLPSRRTRTRADLSDYAASSFPAGCPALQAVCQLNARIHADFTFDPRSTTVHTPIVELLQRRRGVCQDFAHLAIGCFRAMGMAARYVSGYLRTEPPPGQPRLVGVDASHAWLAVYCGPLGWVEIDPTNNSLVDEAHVCLGWGRDYDDVCPIQGVFVGGGEHHMQTAVDVTVLS